MTKHEPPRKRSTAAKALALPLYKQRIVWPKRGGGSYRRKGRTG
jgi:stalled ribosome alternative rescue factor ArfA